MSLARGAVTLLATLLLALPGCRPGPAPPAATARGTAAPESVTRLLGLMRDRLLLMHDVARSKWDARRPVSDPERETALLAEVEGQGRERGLDPQFTRAFFAAQISAAKRIQEDDLARWRAEGRGPFESPPDLAHLRRRIDNLNRELLDALITSGPWPRAAEDRERLRAWGRQALTGEGIEDAVRDAALTPLVADK